MTTRNIFGSGTVYIDPNVQNQVDAQEANITTLQTSDANQQT